MATGIVCKAFCGFCELIFYKNRVRPKGEIIFGLFRILTSLDGGFGVFLRNTGGNSFVFNVVVTQFSIRTQNTSSAALLELTTFLCHVECHDEGVVYRDVTRKRCYKFRLFLTAVVNSSRYARSAQALQRYSN